MRVDSCVSVELDASTANTKTTREATTTPRPMYIHHMDHLDLLSRESKECVRAGILHHNVAA